MSQNVNNTPSILACVTEIVSSHLASNSVPLAEIPGFIRSVHATLCELDPATAAGTGWPVSFGTGTGTFHLADSQAAIVQVTPGARPAPAVPIEESVHHEYIVCLEDGKRLRMLKRYLMTQFGMTPDDYRTKWNLPRNYPMAAPAVVEQRRAHATRAGLGRKRGAATLRSAAD